MKMATLHNVQLPLDLEADFVTPMWTKLEDFYPKYVEIAKAKEQVPFKFKGYVLAICYKLHGIRDRDQSTWFRRYIEHFGSTRIERLSAHYDSLVNEDQVVS